MLEQNLYIPRRLNDPPKLFVFEADAALLFLSCMFFGIMSKQLSIGIVAGAVLSYYYSKSKSGKHPAFMLHIFYWILPIKVLMRCPPSSIREFLG